MSFTSSLTSTLSNYSNITEENLKNKDEIGDQDYLNSTNNSKTTKSFDYSNGNSFFNNKNKKIIKSFINNGVWRFFIKTPQKGQNLYQVFKISFDHILYV